MKYLILGINGMAGHMIAQYLVEQGRDVTGFTRTGSPICKTILGDARNENDIKIALESDKYDIVVNAIGVLNKAVDNSLSEGIYLNSVLPHFLAETLLKTNAKLIQISTDCVFEGTKGQQECI
jgi:dTDP-4-dehydrorhamnose reductase